MTAIGLTQDNKDVNRWRDVEQGKFQCVYATPEQLIGEHSEYFLKCIVSGRNQFMSRLLAVVIDECHCVSDWAEMRKDYKALGLLRQVLDVPFMALSATLPPATRTTVAKTLWLRNPMLINTTELRTNIRYQVIPIEETGSADLNILIPKASEFADESEYSIPVTLVYVDDKKNGINLAEELRRLVPSKFSNAARNVLIRVYFADLDADVRETYIVDLAQGITRIMVCTEACGLGVNLSNIARVVQWKVSNKLDASKFIQRAGRAGRVRDMDAVAILFVPKRYILRCPNSNHDSDSTPESSTRNSKPTKAPNDVEADIYDMFTTAANEDSAERVKQILQNRYMYSTSRSSDQFNWSFSWMNIDPDLIWFINTKGCRQAVLFAAMGQPIISLGSTSISCCDFCMHAHLKVRQQVSWPETLHGVPFQLTLTNRRESGSVTMHEVSESQGADPLESELNPESHSRRSKKVSKARLKALELDLRNWANETWTMLPRRWCVPKKAFLSDNIITKIKSGAGDIQSTEQLACLMAKAPMTHLPQSGLTPFLPCLLERIHSSLEASAHMENARSPTPEFHSTIPASIPNLPWFRSSGAIDHQMQNNKLMLRRQKLERNRASQMKRKIHRGTSLVKSILIDSNFCCYGTYSR